MIKPSYWEPINRSCSRHCRRFLYPISPSPIRTTRRCAATSQSHIWISEEGLSQVFCRFLAQWQRTTSGNNNKNSDNGGKCDREAFARQKDDKRILARGCTTSSSTSRTYSKLNSAQARRWDACSGMLSHQYFRPRIKRQMSPQPRPVATLPRHAAAAAAAAASATSAAASQTDTPEAEESIDGSYASPTSTLQQPQKPKTWGAISSRLQLEGILPQQTSPDINTPSDTGSTGGINLSAPETPKTPHVPSNSPNSPTEAWNQPNLWSTTTAQSINRAVSNSKPRKGGGGYGLRQLLAVRGDSDLINKGFPLTSNNQTDTTVDFNRPDDKRRLVYTEALGKQHAEALVSQFLNMSNRQDTGTEKVLEYKLSWASYPEALNTFVEYLYEPKFHKTENHLTKQKKEKPSWDMFRSRLILGYWMLRLMMPYNTPGLTSRNLYRFLAELMLSRQWQTALWVLHEENVSDPKEVLSEAFKLTKELARQRKKKFKMKSRDRAMQDHISSVVLKKGSEPGTVEADPAFGDLNEFKSRISSVSTTKDLLTQWRELKDAIENPDTILVAMPAIAAIVDRAVEMRLDKTNVWGRHQKQDLLFLCVELFLTLNEQQQAMLLKQLVSFLECWMDLGAAQADKRFKNEKNPENRTIPYLSAFVLFLDPTVRYEAVRVILQRVIVQEHNYANRDKHQLLAVGDQIRKSYGLQGMRDRNNMMLGVGKPQDHILKLVQPEPNGTTAATTTTTTNATQKGAHRLDPFSTTLRRPWSMETLSPLLDIAKHEQTMASRSDTFPKAWRTRELAEILLEFKGRHAVATYLRESSDTEILLFLVRAWLRRSDRYTELLNERKKKNNNGGVKVDMPCERKDFKEFILDNILQNNNHDDSNNHLTDENGDVYSPTDLGVVYVNAISYLDSLGCPTTPLITEILYTLMSLRRTTTLISFEKLLRAAPQPDSSSSSSPKFTIPRQPMIALASYYTIHNPPSALYYIFRLPKMIRLYRNFIYLNASSAHHLSRRALLDFLSAYIPPRPSLPLSSPTNNNSTTTGGRIKGGNRRTTRGNRLPPSYTWWRTHLSSQHLKPTTRNLLAAYTRGISLSIHLKPRQSVRRCLAAFTTALKLQLAPDIRVAEALLFSVVVRRAQQELLQPMKSSLLPASAFLRGFFRTRRVRYYINVLYTTAKKEAALLGRTPPPGYTSYHSLSYRNNVYRTPPSTLPEAQNARLRYVEQMKQRDKRRRQVLERAERFVSWLKEVVWVMKCQGGQLRKEDVRWMYTMSGDLNWQEDGRGVRIDDE